MKNNNYDYPEFINKVNTFNYQQIPNTLIFSKNIEDKVEFIFPVDILYVEEIEINPETLTYEWLMNISKKYITLEKYYSKCLNEVMLSFYFIMRDKDNYIKLEELGIKY